MSRGFPLAGLLRLRHLQEEEAAAELALAHTERRAAERRRHETAEALAGTALPTHGHDTAWRAAIAARAAMSALSIESAAALQLAGVEVSTATVVWSDARIRATALGRLEERHGVQVRAEDERLEQLVLDEAAARMHRSAGAADLSGADAADPTGPTHPAGPTVPTTDLTPDLAADDVSADLSADPSAAAAAASTTDPTTGGTR